MSFPSTNFPQDTDSERDLLMKLLLLEQRTQDYLAGGVVVSNTALTNPAPAPFFSRITALSATIFNTLSGNVSGTNGMALPAGASINGRFTAFQLTSGSVVAYYGS